MNEEELKRLIEKYYNGESTEEEESSLRNYFRKDNIPDGYEAEKLIFSYYTEAAEFSEPSIDFEARLMAGIDASEINGRSEKISRYLLPFKTDSRDTFTDPEMAYAETVKILRDVSSQLNHGAQVLEPVGKMNEITRKSFETINKPSRIVEKKLKSLDYIQKAISLSHINVEKNLNK
jgi:hypothetical protein